MNFESRNGFRILSFIHRLHRLRREGKGRRLREGLLPGSLASSDCWDRGRPARKRAAGAQSFKNQLPIHFSRFALICGRAARGPSNHLSSYPNYFFPPISHHALRLLSNARAPETNATRRNPATNDSFIACFSITPRAGSTLAGTSAAANLVLC
jgi:hypothetical protein